MVKNYGGLGMNFRIAKKIVRKKSSLTKSVKGLLIFYKDRRGLVRVLSHKESPRLNKAGYVYLKHFNRYQKIW